MRKSCILGKIQRLAEFVLTASSPKQDRDGYHYIYDPQHRQRTPSGFGRFYKTPKGWSTNPKYQHGELPYDLIQNLTDSELQSYTPSVKGTPTGNKQIGEHKQKVISGLSYCTEKDIEAVEKLPEHFFSSINPDNIETVSAKACCVTYSNEDNLPMKNKKYKISLFSSNIGSLDTAKGVAHELAHVSLWTSGLLDNPKFIEQGTEVLKKDFQDFRTHIEKVLKSVTKEGATNKNLFDYIFKHKGKGDRSPKQLNNTSKIMLGKKFKDISMEDISNMASFMNCVQCASNSEYGYGHSKAYMRNPKRNNPIEEFYAHVAEDYVTPNKLMNRYFHDSVEYFRGHMEGRVK